MIYITQTITKLVLFQLEGVTHYLVQIVADKQYHSLNLKGGSVECLEFHIFRNPTVLFA